MDFYFNNKPFAAATSAPFAATLPIEATTQPGTYPVKFVAYDGAGHPFYAHSAKIEVPQRVQVTAPHTFTLRSAGDKANLTASVLPGIKVAKISYTIAHANSTSSQVVADANTAPFSADVDLSSRASGDYWVNAIVTSAAGNSYEAWAVPLALTNVPDDNRKVQEANDNAAAEAKVAAVAAENTKRQAAIDAKDASSKTLQETLDWIVRTINHYAIRRETSTIDGAVHEDNYSDAHVEGDQLIFIWEQLDPYLLEHNINRISVNLNEINAAKTEAVEDRGEWDKKRHYGVMIHGQDGMMPIKRDIITGSRYFGGLRDNQHIDFADYDTAKRFVKALKHAVELCTARHPKEPF